MHAGESLPGAHAFVGGARGLSETDLERAYRSRVDPRLNYEQALEMAMRIARHLRREGRA